MKWNNFPIPEAHLVGLVTGTILQIFIPQRLFQLTWAGFAVGLPLFLFGIGTCMWSVIEAKEVNIASPNRLLKSGPYALSRNPMYFGWTFIYIGLSFVINTVWIIAFLPIVVSYIHFVEIRKEEQILEWQFGDEYRQYRKHVRRYI
ncbi:MAG: isoprenylcysteine carboxylmethyltransferase family protein [Anaerolineae bacterium]|nr:isoprenylcysteine carboxylmethyltransferase family protein [Anaerolineae bacterium]